MNKFLAYLIDFSVGAYIGFTTARTFAPEAGVWVGAVVGGVAWVLLYLALRLSYKLKE